MLHWRTLVEKQIISLILCSIQNKIFLGIFQLRVLMKKVDTGKS